MESAVDALEPAWRKAAASSVFALLLAASIALGTATGVLGASGVVLAYSAIFGAFCVVLYLLVQARLGERARASPGLPVSCAYSPLVALALAIARAQRVSVPAQVFAACIAVFLIMFLM